MFLQELGLSVCLCLPWACKGSLWHSAFIRASNAFTVLSTLFLYSANVTVQQNAKSPGLVTGLSWPITGLRKNVE